LYAQAKSHANAEGRTIAGQIEFWALIGKAALDNPDLPIDFVLYPSPGFVESLEPEKYAGADKALAAWFTSFFPGEAAPADVNDPAWRVRLGDLLKRHLLFINLLKLLKGKVVSLEDLQVQMQGPLPEALRPHTAKVLDALLALVGWARSGTSGQPFVNLRVQLWLRELRRMVASVEAKPEEIRLRASGAGLPGHHIPAELQ
jgi:DEAD/DEAH box helicase domain-containing protein